VTPKMPIFHDPREEESHTRPYNPAEELRELRRQDVGNDWPEQQYSFPEQVVAMGHMERSYMVDRAELIERLKRSKSPNLTRRSVSLGHERGSLATHRTSLPKNVRRSTELIMFWTVHPRTTLSAKSPITPQSQTGFTARCRPTRVKQ